MLWLNENAGAVQAMATIVLVVVTLHYAWSTRRMLRLQRASELARFEPIVVLTSLTWFPHFAGGEHSAFRVTVRNVGAGPAFDLTVHLIPHRHTTGPAYPLVRRDEPSFYLEGSTQEDITLPVRPDKFGSHDAMLAAVDAFENGLDMRMWVHYRDGFGIRRTTYSVFSRDDEGNYHVSEPPVRVVYPPAWKRAIYNVLPWKHSDLEPTSGAPRETEATRKGAAE